MDDIIVFNKLSEDEIKQIAGKMLDSLAKRLENMNISITFDDDAVTAISKEGYDPVYGARPLRRAIQQKIEDEISQEILENKISSGDKVSCGYADGSFTFAKQAD